jgi:hypothetical protein
VYGSISRDSFKERDALLSRYKAERNAAPMKERVEPGRFNKREMVTVFEVEVLVPDEGLLHQCSSCFVYEGQIKRTDRWWPRFKVRPKSEYHRQEEVDKVEEEEGSELYWCPLVSPSVCLKLQVVY